MLPVKVIALHFLTPCSLVDRCLLSGGTCCVYPPMK